MAVTRAAITTTDNETVVRWSRLASVEENKAVTVAEILARLVENHIRANGNAVPKRLDENSEQLPDDLQGLS
jgi:hypothetical protein